MGPVTLAALAVIAVPASAGTQFLHPTVRTHGGSISVALHGSVSPTTLPVSPAATPDLTDTVPGTVSDTISDTTDTGHRKIRRGGYVVTRDQLEREQDYPLSSVLVAHFPGIRVVRGGLFNRVASGIHVSIKGDPCFVQMFIDGVFAADGDVDMVNVRDLESIEFRTPGNIPVQFQNRLAGAPCGALLLWSKSS
jgi:hypothetical protein